METIETFAKKLVELMCFTDYRVEVDSEHKHGTIFLHDNPALVKENLPALIECINHLAQLVARKNDQAPIFFDVNNYRHEREALIIELARAAARKVLSTKQSISLPAMNSYERRIVHTELAVHPEVVTESTGMGRGRYVVIKPIEDRGVKKETLPKEVPEGTSSYERQQKTF